MLGAPTTEAAVDWGGGGTEVYVGRAGGLNRGPVHAPLDILSVMWSSTLIGSPSTSATISGNPAGGAMAVPALIVWVYSCRGEDLVRWELRSGGPLPVPFPCLV